MPQVREILETWGAYDIFVKVHVETVDELNSIITNIGTYRDSFTKRIRWGYGIYKLQAIVPYKDHEQNLTNNKLLNNASGNVTSSSRGIISHKQNMDIDYPSSIIIIGMFIFFLGVFIMGYT